MTRWAPSKCFEPFLLATADPVFIYALSVQWSVAGFHILNLSAPSAILVERSIALPLSFNGEMDWKSIASAFSEQHRPVQEWR